MQSQEIKKTINNHPSGINIRSARNTEIAKDTTDNKRLFKACLVDGITDIAQLQLDILPASFGLLWQRLDGLTSGRKVW